MYFLKKNLVNILIWTLAIGVFGTAVNFFIPNPVQRTKNIIHESGLEPNTIANLNIEFNETVNNASDNIPVTDGQSGSDIYNSNQYRSGN